MNTRGELPAAFAAPLAARGITPDAAQRRALALLAELQSRLLQPRRLAPALLARLTGRAKAAAQHQGVYLWGGVGRGKTLLVDLLHLGLPGVPHARLHFHHFMRDVHHRLQRAREQQDPLANVTAALARRWRLLCLDELYVSDIADAMILGRMFAGLLHHGVQLVITSNQAPADLYPGGLQRAQFLPAIALLEQRLQVLKVDGGTDYRLRQLRKAPIYLIAAAGEADARLTQWFEQLAGKPDRASVELGVQGRKLRARRVAGTAVWFEFATLCGGPRSQRDYIELCGEYQTLLLSDVPIMREPDDNAARRFVALVDECYDSGVKLICSAAAAPEQLYSGSRLRAEFSRAVSRLVEMQSIEYLARPHRG